MGFYIHKLWTRTTYNFNFEDFCVFGYRTSTIVLLDENEGAISRDEYTPCNLITHNLYIKLHDFMHHSVAPSSLVV